MSFDSGAFSTAAPGAFVWKPPLKPSTGAILDESHIVNDSHTADIATLKPDRNCQASGRFGEPRVVLGGTAGLTACRQFAST
jgi:hypothetical protein